MPKVDDVAWMSQRHGFLVRQDNDQLIASFEFTSEAEAQAAQNLGVSLFRSGLQLDRHFVLHESLQSSVEPQRPADQRLSRSTVAAGDATICTSTSDSVTGNEQLCPRQTNAAPSVVA